jgi:hypothetical protein
MSYTMVWWFDRPVMKALTRGWADSAINEYSERLLRDQESIPIPVLAAMKNIDAKATGLLTHVSMMIAGLGLIAPLVANHRLEEGIIVFEMALYLVLAIGCLRCLNVFNPHRVPGEMSGMSASLSRELLLRRELYAFCVRAATVLTMCIVVSLPAMYFW